MKKILAARCRALMLTVTAAPAAFAADRVNLLASKSDWSVFEDNNSILTIADRTMSITPTDTDAGATYVSPFLGRLDDISMPGIDLINEITEIFMMHDIQTEIIAASIRNPIHVTDCALAGADIATVPYKVIVQMTKHPLTDAGIEKFQADYKAVFGE